MEGVPPSEFKEICRRVKHGLSVAHALVIAVCKRFCSLYPNGNNSYKCFSPLRSGWLHPLFCTQGVYIFIYRNLATSFWCIGTMYLPRCIKCSHCPLCTDGFVEGSRIHYYTSSGSARVLGHFVIVSHTLTLRKFPQGRIWLYSTSQTCPVKDIRGLYMFILWTQLEHA